MDGKLLGLRRVKSATEGGKVFLLVGFFLGRKRVGATPGSAKMMRISFSTVLNLQ